MQWDMDGLGTLALTVPPPEPETEGLGVAALIEKSEAHIRKAEEIVRYARMMTDGMQAWENVEGVKPNLEIARLYADLAAARAAYFTACVTLDGEET